MAKSLKRWIGHYFESSCSLTPEFAEFSNQIRLYLKKIEGYEVVNFSRGHFYFSTFLRNSQTGKLVYISCSDVRHFPDKWHDSLLIRTASDEKDYTGGYNNYIDITEIKKAADRLTGKVDRS